MRFTGTTPASQTCRSIKPSAGRGKGRTVGPPACLCYAFAMNTPPRRAWTRDEFFAWATGQEGRYEFDGFAPVAMTAGPSTTP
jgi:hypothetical protein